MKNMIGDYIEFELRDNIHKGRIMEVDHPTLNSMDSRYLVAYNAKHGRHCDYVYPDMIIKSSSVNASMRGHVGTLESL